MYLACFVINNAVNGQQSSIQQQHRPTHQNSQPGNLQKLLLNGNGTSTTNINTISIPTLTQHNGGSNHRLAPGGAELNLLPSNSTTSNGAIYRNQGKLIVKGII